MTVALHSRIDRFKQGKALRRKTPRETHADLKGSLTRNAVAILAESDPDRVPELVPERYARMTLNPFAFLRGAALGFRANGFGGPRQQAVDDCRYSQTMFRPDVFPCFIGFVRVGRARKQ